MIDMLLNIESDMLLNIESDMLLNIESGDLAVYMCWDIQADNPFLIYILGV